MHRLKTAAAVLSVLAVTLLPAAGAMFQLGAGLQAVDRLHAGASYGQSGAIEMVGRWSNDDGLTLRPGRVRR